MRKHYDGLEVTKIPLNAICASAIDSSNNCQAMIQLKLENGICISPEWQQQIEYVGDQG